MALSSYLQLCLNPVFNLLTWSYTGYANNCEGDKQRLPSPMSTKVDDPCKGSWSKYHIGIIVLGSGISSFFLVDLVLRLVGLGFNAHKVGEPNKCYTRSRQLNAEP